MPFSTLHATTTVILVGLLWYPNPPPVQIIYTAVASAVFIDADIIFAGPEHSHGHRDLITHSMLPWLLVLVTAVWIPIMFWIAVPILLHLGLDAINGGIMPFAPLSRYRIGGQEVSDGDDYRLQYWGNNKVILVEILTAIGAIIISSDWAGDPLLILVNWCAWVSIAVIIGLAVFYRSKR